MDVFTLAASITLDTTEYEKNLKSAASESKTVKSAMESLITPVDKIQSAFSAITHPVETAKSALDKVTAAAQSFLHPVETMKEKISEASTALETKRNKLSALAAAYDTSKAKVASLTEEFNKSVKESGASSEKTQELAKQLRDAEAASAQAKGDMEAYAESVKKAGEETGEASEKTSSFADKLKSGLATAAKVGAAAIGVASAAVGALTKQSLDGYAEYEQLVGGVETLFKSSANVVMEYANNAYQTAGLSANQYMETVTSFSASLLQSLGGDTEKAAKYADTAITDMSDNANKMGTAMDSIQNAYQGFAKQNYTMLDNLKLGYGGTKEEMQRLLDKANEINAEQGIITDYQIDSYADIVDAIHVVQTEMGITGTTALEASTTIQGSVSAAKSAWENLVAGIGNENADLDVLITNFVDSIGTAGENIIPRVEQILVGIGAAIQKLAPIIGEQLPPLIQAVLPSLLSAGGELIAGLASGIVTAAPGLIETGVPMVASLVSGLSAALPNIASSAVEIVTTLAGGISEQLPTLVPVAVDAVLQLAETLTDPDSLSNMVDSALQLILSLADGLIEALPVLIEKGPQIVMNLVTSIVKAAPKLLSAAAQLVLKLATGIAENAEKILEKGREIVEWLVSGIQELFSNLLNIGRDIVTKVGEGISSLAGAALQWGKDLIDNFVQGIMGAIGKVKEAVANVAGAVADFLGFSEPEKGPLSNFHTYAPDMMQLFAQGITDNAGMIEDSFSKALDFKRDVDFGMARVDFETSAVGVSTAAMANAAYTAAQANGSAPIILNLMFPNGTQFASYYFDPMAKYASANGTPIINPT